MTIGEAYKEGERAKDIAKREGIPLHKVYVILHAEGVLPHHRTVFKTPQDDIDARAAYEGGMSLYRAGQEFGCSNCTMRNAIVRAGGTIRPSTKAKKK